MLYLPLRVLILWQAVTVYWFILSFQTLFSNKLLLNLQKLFICNKWFKTRFTFRFIFFYFYWILHDFDTKLGYMVAWFQHVTTKRSMTIGRVQFSPGWISAWLEQLHITYPYQELYYVLLTFLVKRQAGDLKCYTDLLYQQSVCKKS